MQPPPTSRSRTLLFLSYRDSRAQSSRFKRPPRSLYDDNDPNDANDLNDDGDDEHQRLISPSDTSSPSHGLPPAWVDYSEQVEQILLDTQSKIQQLEKLHAKHVLPGFSDRTQEEREIESITTDITKGFRRCQSLIQRVGSTPQSRPHAAYPPGKQPHHETLAAKNVQRALAAKVQDLSATFRKKQRVYMEKLQGHAIKNQDLLIASGTVSLKGSEGLSALDDDIAAASHTQAQAQSQVQSQRIADQSSTNIQARDRELTEIARSIAELAELFKDLGALVIDQGTLLDSVEYNIEQTGVEMQEAVGELKEATRYQKNTGRRKCIFLLLLIIFGLILVLIFKPRRHGSSSGDERSGGAENSAPEVPQRVSMRIARVDTDGSARVLRRGVDHDQPWEWDFDETIDVAELERSESGHRSNRGRRRRNGARPANTPHQDGSSAARSTSIRTYALSVEPSRSSGSESPLARSSGRKTALGEIGPTTSTRHDELDQAEASTESPRRGEPQVSEGEQFWKVQDESESVDEVAPLGWDDIRTSAEDGMAVEREDPLTAATTFQKVIRSRIMGRRRYDS